MAINLSRRKGKPHTTVLRKGNGDTLSPMIPPRISVLPEPIYGKDTPGEFHLYEEQQVCRVAAAMVKGVRDKHHLMRLLNIPDRKAMDRYIKRVLARWEMEGSTNRHAQHRGEALERLDQIEVALWEQIAAGTPDAFQHAKGRRNVVDTRANIAALSTLLKVSEHRSDIQGLTVKVIERIGLTNAEGVEFSKRVSSHERLSALAARMLTMLDRRMAADDDPPMKTIEHVPDAEAA